MIGSVLGERYEIIEQIGGGGMAVVFKARDKFLGRQVAVKVLKTDFLGDDNFVRRFRREAQAAASLSHPNIVAIYDVGETKGFHYIVMEYVDGRTLKDKVRKEAPLPVGEAVRIAWQICDALEHAHQNRIIHRDIKPHNILLTSEGRVKVTDFGIARAVGGATLVHTGTIMGSAHYFSPEQARGGFTDEKSDLYSLGVVLYEMVTGRVPFEGESPISVAIKHLQERVIPPRSINPGIPEKVERIILKTLEKDPKARYQSASEMLKDLIEVHEEFNEDTRVYHRPDYPAGVMPPVPGGVKETDPPGGPDNENHDTNGNAANQDRKQQGRRRFSVGRLVAFMLVAFILGGTGYGIWWIDNWLNVPNVEVPKVEGLHIVEAQKRLAGRGLGYKIVNHAYHPTIEVNHIIRQDPEPGDLVKKGRDIELVISDGPKFVEGGTPDVTGEHLQVATIKLETSGLLVGKVTREYSEDVPAEYVISQNPRAGTSVKEGTEIDLVVSKGPEPFELPDFTGETLANVRQRLVQQGLREGTITREKSEALPGTVIGQEPPPGTPVQKGDRINLVVSEGGLTKKETIFVKVPEGGRTFKLVKILLTDYRGTDRVIYQAWHRAGGSFEWVVEWVGDQARVVVLVDGVKQGEQILSE